MNLAYSEPDFRTEARAVLGEYNKSSSNPLTKLIEVQRDTAFTIHPYKHTTMGFLADIEAMPEQFDYSRTFFARWYRPDYTTRSARRRPPARRGSAPGRALLGRLESSRGPADRDSRRARASRSRGRPCSVAGPYPAAGVDCVSRPRVLRAAAGFGCARPAARPQFRPHVRSLSPAGGRGAGRGPAVRLQSRSGRPRAGQRLRPPQARRRRALRSRRAARHNRGSSKCGAVAGTGGGGKVSRPLRVRAHAR